MPLSEKRIETDFKTRLRRLGLPNLLVADWMRLMESARGESCPSGQRRGPAAPREDKLHPRMRTPSIPLQLQQPGDENRDHPGQYPPARCENAQPHSVIAYWLGLMEPAPADSCPSGQRRGPAAPREDNFPSPDENSLYPPTTSTTRGRKQRSPGSIPPRKVWKPQPHWVMADWLGSMEPTRRESCPSGQD